MLKHRILYKEMLGFNPFAASFETWVHFSPVCCSCCKNKKLAVDSGGDWWAQWHNSLDSPIHSALLKLTQLLE